MRSQSHITSICKTLADPDFQPRLQFVLWYTDWVGNLERWGSTCSCHSAGYQRGEPVECWRKGRLLQLHGNMQTEDSRQAFVKQRLGVTQSLHRWGWSSCLRFDRLANWCEVLLLRN